LTLHFEERVKKNYQYLTDRQQGVSERFLALGHEAAFLTVAQLARQLNTSEATVIRLVRKLGYRGYPDLQKDFQEGIKEKLSPPKALRDSILKRKKSQGVYSRVFEIEQENLRKTRDVNSDLAIDQAVKEIIRAKKIGVIGFRSSHSVSYLIYFLLGQIRKNCALLESREGSLPNQIVNYGRGDLLICFSLPRYSRETLSVLRQAKKKRCRTMAITDRRISPIGRIADIVLLVSNQTSTYFNSLTSAVALVNCLVAGVSLNGKHSIDTLKEVNQLVNEWEYLLM